MRLPVTVVILAGGQGSRIGGDKALQLLRGRPMIDWVCDAMRDQCLEMFVSANDKPDAYAHTGCAVIPDLIPDYAGPLAGLHAALCSARHDWVACVPCDTPFLPRDLLVRLYAATTTSGCKAAVAKVAGERQPAVAIFHRSTLHALDSYLATGKRRVSGFLDSLHLCEVEFDDATAFVNINTKEDLKEHS